jgi:hypothetical protein
LRLFLFHLEMLGVVLCCICSSPGPTSSGTTGAGFIWISSALLVGVFFDTRLLETHFFLAYGCSLRFRTWLTHGLVNALRLFFC